MTSISAATTKHWLEFFTSAGLPSSTAADYAHIFVKNRMQMNMLEDLTKDYLREMSITAMGDIISILRHAKMVREQSARDKILTKSENRVPVATIAAKPKSVAVPTITIDDPPKIRRVLPEHEGKYKIIQPSGTTSRSKEILAKRAQLQSDQMSKKSIFDRLNANNDVEMVDSTSNSDQVVKLIGLRSTDVVSKQTSSSIFNRLGNKKPTDSEIEKKSIAFAGILKNSPTKKTSPRGIVKTKVSKQKVLFVKKFPTKISADSETDDSDSDRVESDSYKSVSFSPEVEVLEIAPREKPVSPNKKFKNIKGLRTDGIKSRLGAHSTSDAFIHSTKKVIKLKPSSTKVSSSSMVADIASSKTSVHQRLSLQNKTSTSQLTSKIKRFSLDSVPTSSTDTNGKKSSVFSRLGINK